jgi:anthranilate synthase component 1
MLKPTIRAILSDVETPVSLFHKLCADEPMAFLLESTEGDTRLARFSFIGFQPLKTVKFTQGQAFIQERGKANRVQRFENPLDVLQSEMAESFPEPPSQETVGLPFSGGWVGYMGYGATQYFDRIPQQSEDPFGVPDGYYGLYDTIIGFDHLLRRITFLSYRPEVEALELWADLNRRLVAAPQLSPLACDYDQVPEATIFQSVRGPFDRERFCATVDTCQNFIREGQIFQIVLSHRFSLPVKAPAINVYRMVQALNPSPYAYYLKYPEFDYIGASPETFVRCQQGEVMLKALAGTRPRGATSEEDEALAAALRVNEKELAEHRMLVDLGRNDLGRMCAVGSIQVGEIATLTRYTHVMHLATELKGQLRADRTAYDVFRSCFPRGTVSGAPKIRAMQLLSTLEPERRGVYSGAVGYFDLFGNMDSAIAIRSVLLKDGLGHVNAGAGIVYDSNPDAEYEETRNKAKSMLKAVQLAERMAEHAGTLG